MPKLKYTNFDGLYEEEGRGDFDLSGDGAIFGHREKIKTSTANNTLTLNDSGKTIMVDGSTTHTITLPSAAAGVWFKFYCTDSTAAVNIAQAAAGEDFFGTIFSAQGGTTNGTADADNTKIVISTSATVGDWVILQSDGSFWYVQGNTYANSSVTFSD